MKTAYKILSSLAIILVFLGCKPQKTNEVKTTSSTIAIIEDTDFLTIADTIITDVVIKNPDNDEWTNYCLRKLDKETLINDLFDLVYSGKLVPYNFFTDEIMLVKEIKSIEKKSEYSRKNIAKVQFEESWNFDKHKQKITKKVHSIMIAYELYSSDGSVKGYKPVFKVYLN